MTLRAWDTPDRGGDELLELALETYLFGFASVEMFRTMHDLAASEAGDPRTRFNAFSHQRGLATSESEWLASPNTEMLYSNAWLDLGRGPLLLKVPGMGSRYYVVHVVDFFANSVAHIGARACGGEAGEWVIAGPDWSGDPPQGLRVVTSPTRFAWILARIHVPGEHELGSVHALQDQLRLESLTPHAGNSTMGETWPPFRGNDGLDFFSNLDLVLRRNAPPADAAALAARLPQLGLLAGDPFVPNAIEPRLREILERAVALGNQRICERESQFEEFCPGWIWEGLSAGGRERDHLTRAASAKAGLGILCPQEAIYPFSYVDDKGEPLNGDFSYRISFSPEELPRAAYFWWITVYALPHYRLVANSMNRCIWGSANGRMEPGANGKFELLLQPDCPAGMSANWLPTPARKNFVVALRVFGPAESMLTGKHRLPRVRRISSENHGAARSETTLGFRTGSGPAES